MGFSVQESQNHSQSPYQVKLTWFNYFSRRIFNHNLTSIKVLKCELKSTQCFNQSNLMCHVQVIPIPLEHLKSKTQDVSFLVLESYLPKTNYLEFTIIYS